MEVEIEGVIYQSKAARNMCEGCVAYENTDLCADMTDKFPCSGVIWIKKKDKESVKNIK